MISKEIVTEVVNLRACHAVVGEQEPEAKDWFGENVKDCICDNFGINGDNTATIGDAPDADAC